MNDPFKPSVALLSKIGSLIVHMQEFASPSGHEYDGIAVNQLLNDPDVIEWMKQMGPLLPVLRRKP